MCSVTRHPNGHILPVPDSPRSPTADHPIRYSDQHDSTASPGDSSQKPGRRGHRSDRLAHREQLAAIRAAHYQVSPRGAGAERREVVERGRGCGIRAGRHPRTESRTPGLGTGRPKGSRACVPPRRCPASRPCSPRRIVRTGTSRSRQILGQPRWHGTPCYPGVLSGLRAWARVGYRANTSARPVRCRVRRMRSVTTRRSWLCAPQPWCTATSAVSPGRGHEHHPGQVQNQRRGPPGQGQVDRGDQPGRGGVVEFAGHGQHRGGVVVFHGGRHPGCGMQNRAWGGRRGSAHGAILPDAVPRALPPQGEFPG